MPHFLSTLRGMLVVTLLSLFLTWIPVYSAPVEIGEACKLTLSKITIRFTPDPAEKRETVIETPTRLSDLVQKAVAVVQKRGITDPMAYREAVEKEVAREKATQRARETVAQDIEAGTLRLPSDPQERQRAIEKEVIKRTFDEARSATRESILFVDTPVVGADGKSLNGTIPLVIDHHGAYAPENPLNNSGAQVLLRLKAAAESPKNKNVDGSVNVRKAMEDFQTTLFGRKGGKVVLSADNLADGAEVMAMLRSPVLQKRLLENPELLETLLESGRFTDFFVFGGDTYEKKNTSERSKNAITLSKAIMQSHSDLLAEFGIGFGDRVVGLIDQSKQQELLKRATDAAEALLLAATETDSAKRAEGLQKVNQLARRFDQARNQVSLSAAKKMHEAFTSDLSIDLRGDPNAKDLTSAIQEYTFGHKPVSTGNQFADWGASPIANAQSDRPRPIKFELGGAKPEDVGKPVILAKSGSKSVDLRPVAAALNRLAQQKRKNALVKTGLSEEKATEEAGRVNEFTARGTDLVFSFGGHSLSRAEVVKAVGEALKENHSTIAP